MKKWISLISLCSSIAQAMPVTPLRDVNPTANQARQVLEEKMGEALSENAFARLQTLIAKERPQNLVEIGNQPSSKSILCVGWNGSSGGVMGHAACVHIWSMKGYELVFLGAGMALNFTGQVFRLKVTFDPSRYDNSFDPIPGRYAFAQQSLTLGGGISFFSGSAGNKILTGSGVNFGIGFDLTSISFLDIQ